MVTATLDRTTFETSRELEFFSEKELQMQIGHERRLWLVALAKELIDNALDACETADIAPEIAVTVEPDAVSVRDNGPGLPAATLERSLDYLVRVSDKAHYVSPTRGQLGNALKCVWAAPFVVDGEGGRVEVLTGGRHHTVDVVVDRIGQRPELRHAVGADGLVRNGTLVRLGWPATDSYLDAAGSVGSYSIGGPHDLLSAYSLFNPHASFRLREGAGELAWPRTDAAWRKWKPSAPTSPHWYGPERLRDLVAAYVAEERRGGRARTVREFVAEFNGLSSPPKQKVVVEAAGLSRAHLRDLVTAGDVDAGRVAALLDAMRRETRPVKPDALGTLGERHLRDALVGHYGAEPESVRYKRVRDEEDGLPFVLGVAFGVLADGREEAGRRIVAGLNWSPSIALPFRRMPFLLGEARADSHDPIVLVAHLARPGLQFADRGKGVLSDV